MDGDRGDEESGMTREGWTMGGLGGGIVLKVTLRWRDRDLGGGIGIGGPG